MNRKWLLWIECIGIFVAIPLLLWLRVVNTPLIIIPVIIICVPATIWLVKKYGLTQMLFWLGDRDAEYKQLIIIINRFILLSIVLFAILFVWYPLHLFDLLRNKPMFWLMFLLVYPLFSVYPQELLYRVFFF